MKQLNFFISEINGAEFSDCRKYRFSLWRFWDIKKGYAAFVCLNPSTADESKNDPTVRRCINYAKGWNYGGMMMLNIFAFRSTEPKNLLLIEDPVGDDNDFHIRAASSKAQITIAAWGNNRAVGSRGREVLKLLNNPHYLALTNCGNPKHPLYLKKNLFPVPYGETWKV